MHFALLTTLVASVLLADRLIAVDSSSLIPTLEKTSSGSTRPPPPTPRSPLLQSARGTRGTKARRPPASYSPRSRRNHRGHLHGSQSGLGRRIERTSRRKKKINLGKKVGLVFIGVASLLQFAVAGFLVFKRWQISKVKWSEQELPA